MAAELYTISRARESLQDTRPFGKDRWVAAALAVASFVAMFVAGPWFVISFLAFTAYAARSPGKQIDEPPATSPSPAPSTAPGSRRSSG